MEHGTVKSTPDHGSSCQPPGHGARRGLSPILFWYFLREFTVPLASCLLGFTAIFLLSDLFDVLEDFLESGAPVADIILFFALRQPVNLVNVLPMSLLLSACLMIYMLRRHHEVAALRAAGLSMISCCLPIWCVGMAFAGLCFWFGEGMAPRCAARAEEINDLWTRSASYREHGRAKLAFTNHSAARDWYFEAFDPHGIQAGILVKQFRPDGSTAWELQAARAFYNGRAWTFFRGRLSRFDEKGQLPDGQEHHFERFSTRALDETPAQIANSLRPVEELSIRRMLQMMRLNPDMPKSLRRVFTATIWYRATFPLSCIIAPLVGVAFSLTEERGGALRGFAQAVGSVVFYYLVSQLFLVFGRTGLVPPFAGGAVPTLAFLGFGAYQMYKRR